MKKYLIGATCAALAGLAGAGPAAAQDGTCRASAARVTTAVGTNTEPVRANAAGSPCTSQSAHTVAPTTLPGIPVSADAVGAFTDKGGAAYASAAHASVGGPLAVTATTVEATGTAPCGGIATGTSRVVGLTIQGQSIVLPPGDAPQTLPFGPLGTVYVNEEIKEGSKLTRRAIRVSTPEGEAVLAEAVVAPGKCPSPPPPPVCPEGSKPDPERNVCVITETSDDDDDGDGDGDGDGGNNTNNNNSNTNNNNTNNTNNTPVSAPFAGPEGGTVMSIEAARKLAPKSPCLKRKKGPKYAIVGSKKRDRITGTNRSERIILRGGNDNAEGGRGNDCIDGGTGKDTMSGALGKDRIYGGKGKDHLIGGSHADRLYGGPKGDTINSGFGKDRIDAGKGNDKINAATAGPASKSIKCGKGRDKVRVNRNEKRKAKKRKNRCERVYVIR